MAKFKYKYDRLLALREIEEKKEIAELTKIRSNIEKKEIEQQNKKDEINAIEEKVEALEFFSVDDIRFYSSAISDLNREIENIQQNIKELKEKEKQQHEIVVEISKKKKILEKLKEKHKIEFYKEENKKINDFMDELANQRFKRKKTF